MQSDRVVITGGSGLIGRALTADLAAAGYEVVIFSRNPERVRDLPLGVRAEAWHSQIAQEATIIVNLAGESLAAGRWTAERKRRILESRVTAGEFVSRAVEAARIKPRVVVQASAVGYYGPRGDEEVTEQSASGSGFLAPVCLAWEASTAPVETLGVRRPIIRTGVVLSTKGGALPRLLLPFRLFVGGPLGSGRQWFPWIHLADEVGAIRFLIENESARGPFNLASPRPVTNAAFSTELGEVLGRPSSFRVPGSALRLALGEMATALLDGQRALPRRLIELGYAFRFPDVHSALTDLLK